ncbi:hypothetical protein D1007_12833 [Hordeum vulgare]|nr:hypothetical protein D1007_12833 [Hordeum vulgare]
MRRGEEEERHVVPMEEEGEEPHDDEELAVAPGCNMEEAKAEFTVAQSVEMTEQRATVGYEAYVKASRQFIRQERTAADTLFVELDVEAEEAQETEVCLSSMCPEPCTETVDISNED